MRSWQAGCAAVLLMLATTAVVGAAAAAAPAAGDIDAAADSLAYQQEQQLLVGKGNVRVAYQDIVITADEIEINTETRDIVARGNVRVTRGAELWQGERVSGNLNTKAFDFGESVAASPPWYLKGRGVQRDSDGTLRLRRASITSCGGSPKDFSTWRMDARRVTYAPDGRFRAYGVVYKLYNIPIFYSPVAWGHSNEGIGNFEFEPGYRSDFGGILHIAKEWEPAAGVRTKVIADYRTKRGIALGNRTRVDTKNSRTDVSVYGLPGDNEPPSDTTVGGNDYNGRFDVEEDRFRVRARHRSTYGDHLTLRVNADYLSDNDVLREFFRDDYRRDPQAPTFVDVTYARDRFELSLNYRPRVNPFESVVERLPELRLDMPRQQILGTRFYYQGRNSVARLRVSWRDYDVARNNPGADPAIIDADDYASDRFDSLHMIYAPFDLAGMRWVPRAGVRLTHYSRTSRTKVDDDQLNADFLADDPRPSVDNPWPVTNYDDLGGSETRVAWELGLHLSTKFYRTRSQLRTRRWALDGLRHVVEPYLDYTYIPAPNVDKENLYFFDDVDRIDKTNVVRFGQVHRFQTRRGRRIHTFARVETYYDLHLSTEHGEPRSGDLGAVVNLDPTETFGLWAKLLLGTANWEMDVINVGGRFGNPDGVYATLSYLFRDDFRTRLTNSMGSDRTHILAATPFPTFYEANHSIAAALHLPLGPKTQFGTELWLDLDRGRTARQSYELTRDLGCWVGMLRVVDEPGDLAVLLTLWLKAFPKIRVGGGI